MRLRRSNPNGTGYWRDAAKFDHLLEVGGCLPRLRGVVTEHLRERGLSHNGMMAAVRLLAELGAVPGPEDVVALPAVEDAVLQMVRTGEGPAQVPAVSGAVSGSKPAAAGACPARHGAGG
ncbi:MAG TPA: hypothetical protein VHH34_20710 [Pseudonocardiaceae bacterium]|nr:hypothetical protein [Pseudonocardiaceae bacterium]